MGISLSIRLILFFCTDNFSFFCLAIFMFSAHEHVFTALELVFTGAEHKFTLREHKNCNVAVISN